MRRIILGLSILFLVSSSAAFSESAVFKFGIAKVDITPYKTDGFKKIYLAGFGPYYPIIAKNRKATGIHDQIWARAIALQGSNGVPLILEETDLPGLSFKYINPVRRRLAKEFHIPYGNIIIGNTHTHAAPDACGFWVTLLPGHNKRYTNRLKQWMYEAAAQAIRSMQPAKMKVVTTTHYSCYDPETLELKKEPNCNIPDTRDQYDNPQIKHDDFLVQSDIRDPIVRNTRIVAAQFTSADTGQTIGTFVDWNNHPDSLGSDNLLISSDYPHYLRQYVERALGGTAIYFTGTLGRQIGSVSGTAVPLWNESFERVLDANGKPVFVRDYGYDKIRSIGYEVASEVVSALQNDSGGTSDVPIHVNTQGIDLPVDNFLHQVFTYSAWYYDVEWRDRMTKIPWGCDIHLGCVHEDLSILQIGDLGLATAPGEIDPSYFLGRHASTANYGKKFGHKTYPAMIGLDPFLPGTHHAMLGQANGYLSYLLARSDNVGWWNFKHPNHYEEFVTISASFGDRVFEKLFQMVGEGDGGSSRVDEPDFGP